MSLRIVLRAVLSVALLAAVLAVAGVQPAASGPATSCLVTDPGDGAPNIALPSTLRDAFKVASNGGCKSGGEPVIKIQLPGPTYQIDLTHCSGGGHLDRDDLDYTGGGTLTILNDSGNKVTVNQTCTNERVVHINPGNLVVDGMTSGIAFTGGNYYRNDRAVAGGGIWVSGEAHLTNVEVSLNSAISAGSADAGRAFGGGLRAGGNVTLLGDSAILNNMAKSETGGQTEGGGVFTAGTLQVTNSLINGNTASSAGISYACGAGIAGETGERVRGGGAYSRGPVTLEGAMIDDNTARHAGREDVLGGGVYSEALIQATDSRINGNTAENTWTDTCGVGAVNGFEVFVRGGGLHGTGVNLLRSQVTDNTADAGNYQGEGGGVASMGGVEAINTTISTNTAKGGTFERGGGIWQNAGQRAGLNVSLIFSTVILNTADVGSNLRIDWDSLTGWASIIAEGSDENCSLPNASANNTGWFWANDDSCQLTPGQDNVDGSGDLPVQSTAATNGSESTNETLNHLPDATRNTFPQIVDVAPCRQTGPPIPTNDQRQVSRPQTQSTDLCDIGSVEIVGVDAFEDDAHVESAASVIVNVVSNDKPGRLTIDKNVQVTAQPSLAGATATVSGQGLITYNSPTPPNPNYVTDTFTYKICDTTGTSCDEAVVTVHIYPRPVDAKDDSGRAQSAGSTWVDVEANDRNPDGTNTTVTIYSQPSYGTATVNGDDRIRYQAPETLVALVDTFEYQVCIDSPPKNWPTPPGQGDYTPPTPPQCDVATVTIYIYPPEIEIPEQPEASPTATPTPDVGPTTVPRPPAKKPAPAGKYTAPKFTG